MGWEVAAMTNPERRFPMTIWQAVLAVYLILVALVGFGVALPAMVLAIFALLAAVAVAVGK